MFEVPFRPVLFEALCTECDVPVIIYVNEKTDLQEEKTALICQLIFELVADLCFCFVFSLSFLLSFFFTAHSMFRCVHYKR